MKRSRPYILAMTLAMLMNGLSLPAFAQFGFGFGSWHGNFGTWFGVWPWGYGGRGYYPPAQRTAPAKQTSGYLEGNVTIRQICPTSYPNLACPVRPEALSSVTITAQPSGSTQWLASRPDTQGRFRLVLPPGSYNVAVHHPLLNNTDQSLRQVTIQSGKTAQQDFQIALPVQ